ncbi:MAG: hypothetical protein KGL39_46955 [Patescibacteria group bacterium]|nr:hypothetical protein [Patescibacteria group bacterium]
MNEQDNTRNAWLAFKPNQDVEIKLKFTMQPTKDVMIYCREILNKSDYSNILNKPISFPCTLWEELPDYAKAMVIARNRYEQEDWWNEINEAEESKNDVNNVEVSRNAQKSIKTRFSNSMVGGIEPNKPDPTPMDIWQAVDKRSKEADCKMLPEDESKNLWLISTERKGEIMFIVCEFNILKEYIDEKRSIPVKIWGTPNFLSIRTGDAHSLKGWCKVGWAAEEIGRLAYYYDPKLELEPKPESMENSPLPLPES